MEIILDPFIIALLVYPVVFIATFVLFVIVPGILAVLGLIN